MKLILCMVYSHSAEINNTKNVEHSGTIYKHYFAFPPGFIHKTFAISIMQTKIFTIARVYIIIF